MKSTVLSQREIRIFSQQIEFSAMGLAGQEKLKKAKVLIIGAGGKGTAILQNLVVAGVGYLGISDNMLVEETDLPKQRLYGHTDLGKHRAIVSKEKLAQLCDDTRFELHNICISAKNIQEILNPYDVIADATDNFEAHYLIDDAAIALHKPVVFGSVKYGKSMISVFNYQGGPSFRRLFPEKPAKSSDSRKTDLNAQGILYNLTGTIMANEMISILKGKSSKLNGLLMEIGMRDYDIKFTKIP